MNKSNRARVLGLTAMALTGGAGIALSGPILRRRIEDLRFKQVDEDAVRKAEEKRARKAAKLRRDGL